MGRHKKQKPLKPGDTGVDQVYFIQEEATGFVKIGKSRRPGKRIALLQTSTPHRLKILATFPEEDGAKEEHFHSRFHHLRYKGEWFQLGDGPNSIKDYILTRFGADGVNMGWVYLNGKFMVHPGTHLQVGTPRLDPIQVRENFKKQYSLEATN